MRRVSFALLRYLGMGSAIPATASAAVTSAVKLRFIGSMKHPRVAVALLGAACIAVTRSATKNRTPFHNHTDNDIGVPSGGVTEIRRGLQTMDVESMDWNKVPRVGLTNQLLLCTTTAVPSSHVRPACLSSSPVVQAFEDDPRVTGKYMRSLADVVLYT